LNNSVYQQPNFQLTYAQLKTLTANCLFIQFCNEIALNQLKISITIRQLLKILPNCKDLNEIYQTVFSTAKKQKKTNK